MLGPPRSPDSTVHCDSPNQQQSLLLNAVFLISRSMPLVVKVNGCSLWLPFPAGAEVLISLVGQFCNVLALILEAQPRAHCLLLLPGILEAPNLLY